MPGNYWIKLYLEILDDSKIAILPDRLWRRIIELFLLAGRYGKNGELPETLQLAWSLRTSTDELELELKQIEAVGIIEKSQTGWIVIHFAERQAPVPDAIRAKEYRRRLRSDQYNAGETVTVASRNVTQNRNRTETEQKELKQKIAIKNPMLNESENIGFRLFSKFVQFLKTQIKMPIFAKYLGNASFVSLQEGELSIGIDSREKINWLNDRTQKMIKNSIPAFGGVISSVKWVLSELEDEQLTSIDLYVPFRLDKV